MQTMRLSGPHLQQSTPDAINLSLVNYTHDRVYNNSHLLPLMAF